MSAQLFPSLEETLDILMAEVPRGVYATDGADDPNPDKRSVSSAELRAHAALIAGLYENLMNIYADKFASTVTPEGLPLWENDYFNTPQDQSQTFQVRKNNLIAKIRFSGGISLPAIRDVIGAILDPLGIDFEIYPWSGQFNGVHYGSWIFEFSQLDVDTYLGLRDPLWGAQQDPGLTPLDCNLDWAAAGITQQEMIEIQNTAYTYEVRIYGNADALTLALIDRQLTALEPARSTHVIRNNATGPLPP